MVRKIDRFLVRTPAFLRCVQGSSFKISWLKKEHPAVRLSDPSTVHLIFGLTHARARSFNPDLAHSVNKITPKYALEGGKRGGGTGSRKRATERGQRHKGVCLFTAIPWGAAAKRDGSLGVLKPTHYFLRSKNKGEDRQTAFTSSYEEGMKDWQGACYPTETLWMPRAKRTPDSRGLGHASSQDQLEQTGNGEGSHLSCPVANSPQKCSSPLAIYSRLRFRHVICTATTTTQAVV